MPATTAPGATIPVTEETLHEVIETLAAVERPPCSDGERYAAAWIADRLRAAGCDVSVEHEDAWGPWPPNLTALGALGTFGALLAMFGRRFKGALYAALALAGLVDEIQNGPRIFRRMVRSKKQTVNVVATTGDRSATTTLVVLAHHDAAQTGLVFDQAWAITLHQVRPHLVSIGKRQIPQWWLGVAGPVLTILSAVTRWRRPARWAVALGALGTGLVSNIMRSPTVPGANDNLSGVAALVGLAESLAERPIDGVRVMLVSAGSEESFQEGIRAFMDRHRSDLDPAATHFLNLDTIGSSHLVMVEGEGPVWTEGYAGERFRDLVAGCAAEHGISLHRGAVVRASTDGIVPSRAGFATATLISMMPWGLPGNYHLMTDTPGNVRYESIVDSIRLAYSVGERLASEPREEGGADAVVRDRQRT